MEEGSKVLVKADMIDDIKRIDEQLQRHLNRVWAMQNLDKGNKVRITQKQDWEIDPTKLIIKQVIARGAFGTVHRGLYDGKDVAGKNFYASYLSFFFGWDCCFSTCTRLMRLIVFLKAVMSSLCSLYVCFMDLIKKKKDFLIQISLTLF